MISRLDPPGIGISADIGTSMASIWQGGWTCRYRHKHGQDMGRWSDLQAEAYAHATWESRPTGIGIAIGIASIWAYQKKAGSTSIRHRHSKHVGRKPDLQVEA